MYSVRKKKREILGLAKALCLCDLCITGKPGYIVVEGEDKNVKKFLSTIRRRPWQILTVSLIEGGLSTSDGQHDTDTCRKIDPVFANRFVIGGAAAGEKSDLKMYQITADDKIACRKVTVKFFLGSTLTSDGQSQSKQVTNHSEVTVENCHLAKPQDSAGSRAGYGAACHSPPDALNQSLRGSNR
eukprot:g19736.t1